MPHALRRASAFCAAHSAGGGLQRLAGAVGHEVDANPARASASRQARPMPREAPGDDGAAHRGHAAGS